MVTIFQFPLSSRPPRHSSSSRDVSCKGRSLGDKAELSLQMRPKSGILEQPSMSMHLVSSSQFSWQHPLFARTDTSIYRLPMFCGGQRHSSTYCYVLVPRRPTTVRFQVIVTAKYFCVFDSKIQQRYQQFSHRISRWRYVSAFIDVLSKTGRKARGEAPHSPRTTTVNSGFEPHGQLCNWMADDTHQPCRKEFMPA